MNNTEKPNTERHELITRMLDLRRESQQILTDAAHWNSSVRKPDEAPIDPDPDCDLANIILAVENAVAKELLCVHVIGPDDVEAVASLAEGDRRALELNTFFDSLEKTENTPLMEARVEGWHRDAAGHAEDLAQQAANR
jgi:hypothetical protein